MNSKIRFLGALLAGTMFSTSMVKADDKPAAKLAELFPDEVLVKGKGFQVKRSDLDEALATVKADTAARGEELPADKLPLIEIKLLDHLTQVELLKVKATPEQIKTAEGERDKRMEAIRKQFPSTEAMNLQLKARGMSTEQFLRRLRDEALFETVLLSKVSISDAQIKKFYDDNPAQFEEPELVKVSHLLLAIKDPKTGSEAPEEEKKAKKTKIEELLKRARAGEDFAKLVRENTDDLASKNNDGEYTFPRMAPGFPEEFKAAAFSLKTNQVSDVVSTPFGYHIIKLMSKTPAHTVELAKTTDGIRNFLQRQSIERMLPGLYESLKKESDVQFVDEKYKALEVESVAKAAKLAAELQKDAKPQEKAK